MVEQVLKDRVAVVTGASRVLAAPQHSPSRGPVRM